MTVDTFNAKSSHGLTRRGFVVSLCATLASFASTPVAFASESSNGVAPQSTFDSITRELEDRERRRSAGREYWDAYFAVKSKLAETKLYTPGEWLATVACMLSYSQPKSHAEGCDGTRRWLGAYHSVWGERAQYSRCCLTATSTATQISGLDTSMRHVWGGGGDQYVKSEEFASKWSFVGWWRDLDESVLEPGDCFLGLNTKSGELPRDVHSDDVYLRHASPNAKHHSLMYVGGDIPRTVYEGTLAGTDADFGEPGSDDRWVCAHGGPMRGSSWAPAICDRAMSLADYRGYRDWYAVFRPVNTSPDDRWCSVLGFDDFSDVELVGA